jgi:DNA helicase-2/ATP-dependent DNA helicase PcrA
MPLDLIKDISRGNSWLSFAKSSTVKENKYAAGALKGENRKADSRSSYSGKTYNNSEAINEFFKNKKRQVEKSVDENTKISKKKSGFDKLKEFASKDRPDPAFKPKGKFIPGTHVRHAKYGKGLVLRREGTGDTVKLTVSFPGFGQKKLIEKFAKLESA